MAVSGGIRMSFLKAVTAKALTLKGVGARDVFMTLAGDVVRAYRMNLAQAVTELAIALVVLAILFGGIAGGIFFQTNTTGWDATSSLVWGYIFPIALSAVLVMIIGHMYYGMKE